MKLKPETVLQCKILYQDKVLDIVGYDQEVHYGEITAVQCLASPSFHCDSVGNAMTSTLFNFTFSNIKPVSDIALGGYDPDTPYLIEPEKDDTWVASDKTEPVGDLWAVEQLEYEKAFVEADETVEQTAPVGKKKTDTASNCLTNVICNIRLVLPNVGTFEAPLAELVNCGDGYKVYIKKVND